MASKSKQYAVFALMAAVLLGLYFTTSVNYLLFHSLVEIFSIVVAFSFFTIAWNSRNQIKNQYLLFIGVAYLFIAFLDLLHTLSYKGMPIFTDYDFYANQLWIGARFMESITLVIAFYYLGKKETFNPEVLFVIYAIITAVMVASIFVWKVFPECFIEGVGLTPFKKYSEYIICLILFSAILLLHRRKESFELNIYKTILISLIFTIISELAFTFYISNYGISNLIGHYFKLFSFYLLYKAIVRTGIRNPYDLIFKELTTANTNLKNEIDTRISIQKENEKLIENLQSALSQIKTLRGLLPICSHCKKIRDDKGYWNSIEIYLEKHSEAELSHSICQECAKEHYPDYDIYDEQSNM